MTSQEIRNSFLDFFRSKNHHIVPSAPVVPQSDPTLLFTNAGMNQFKDIFLGNRKRTHPRIADSQKCIRVSGKHNDLEEVGRDTYHHTFFEMLGNWSFGDYFKAEAIAWAWELLVNVWKLPKERLYATVFGGDETEALDRDEETALMWQRMTEIDPSHILYFGKKDNFWEMGESGPCGPCSEIHIDLGPEYESFADPRKSGVNTGSARYIELWNLVFIQYNRDAAGKLHLLPAKHVDTGAGFERLVAVLQNKGSNYATDLFAPIQEAIADFTKRNASEGGEVQVGFNVLSDHIRALSFAIADGAIPGNEGRGYVLRRLLRRAARFGRVLGMQKPFIYRLVSPLSIVMGGAYPEISQRRDYIERVIRAEEESFNQTLDRGIDIFESQAAKILARGETVFPGKDAFLLHDTYGFPLDLTQLMAQEKGLQVDASSFQVEMEKQRKRSTGSREAVYQTVDVDESLGGSEFVGYIADEIETQVVAAEDKRLILRETPFYAEGGGQVGDRGWIENDHIRFQVEDTKQIGEHIVHFGRLQEGSLPDTGDPVRARIDTARRRATERNHTVTHLLHKALRQVLGEHVHQAGSLVHPDYMRFDFTHYEKVVETDLRRIERIVNERILENRKVSWQMLPFKEAVQKGAMALFGEKYGDTVRMVQVADFSSELCGGTHVRATGEIGEFIIISESAVAAGIRRIEAITGLGVYEYLRSREETLRLAGQVLGCAVDEVPQRIQSLLEERKELDVEVRNLRQQSAREQVAEILDQAVEIADFRVAVGRLETRTMEDLKNAGDRLRETMGSGVGVLATEIEGKANLVCMVTRDLVERYSLHAGEIVKQIARLAGGGGGGSPHMATAGAKSSEKLSEALSQVEKIVKSAIEQVKG
ncbi:alanine--tRNA ligase [candidate division KSB1 bacterium]|nr:alanine--tRNA ligase [candidate division KSB1 bacterium]